MRHCARCFSLRHEGFHRSKKLVGALGKCRLGFPRFLCQRIATILDCCPQVCGATTRLGERHCRVRTEAHLLPLLSSWCPMNNHDFEPAAVTFRYSPPPSLWRPGFFSALTAMSDSLLIVRDTLPHFLPHFVSWIVRDVGRRCETIHAERSRKMARIWTLAYRHGRKCGGCSLRQLRTYLRSSGLPDSPEVSSGDTMALLKSSICHGLQRSARPGANAASRRRAGRPVAVDDRSASEVLITRCPCQCDLTPSATCAPFMSGTGH